MPFEKGHNKATGRPKGSSNFITSEVREALAKLFNDNYDQMQRDMDQLEPHQRLKVMLELAQYNAAKLRSIEVNDLQQPTQPIMEITIKGK